MAIAGAARTHPVPHRKDGVLRYIQRIRRRNVRDVVHSVFVDTCAKTGVPAVTATDDDDVDSHAGHFYSMKTRALCLCPEKYSGFAPFWPRPT